MLLPRFVYGSVEKGAQLGEMLYSIDGKVVKSVPLFADSKADLTENELTFLQKILRLIGVYT